MEMNISEKKHREGWGGGVIKNKFCFPELLPRHH